LPQAQIKRFSLKSSAFLVFAGAISVSTGCYRAPSPEVLATVNGKEIMAADVERIYKQSLGDNALQPSKEVAAVQRINILHQMIQDEIMQQRAAKLNLVATDEEVDAKLTEMKTPFTQEEFDRQLKEKNLSLEELRREIRREITSRKLINKEIESKINITDAEIGNYYNAHKSEFDLVEPVYHVARIVVTNQPSKQVSNLQNSKANNDSEAKGKIKMIRGQLDNGENFASIAQRFSEDPSNSASGGDLGLVPETPFRTSYPDVFAAISKLKAGQTTDVLPIISGDGPARKIVGYAIYMLIDKRPAGQRDLNDPRVQQSIRQQLREGQAQMLQSAYYEMIYNEAKIHNYLAEQIFKNGAS